MGFAGFELTVPLLVLGMASATQWKRYPVHLQNKDSQQTWDPSDPTDPGIKDRKIPRVNFGGCFFRGHFILILDQKVGCFFSFRIPKRSFYLRFGWSKRNGPTRKNWPRKKDGHVFFFGGGPCFLNLPRMALDLSTKKSNDVFFWSIQLVTPSIRPRPWLLHGNILLGASVGAAPIQVDDPGYHIVCGGSLS